MNIDIIEVLKDLDPNYELKPIEEALWKELQKTAVNVKVRFVKQMEIPNLFEVVMDTRVFYLMVKPEDLPLIGTGGDCVSRYRYLFQECRLTDQVNKIEVSKSMKEIAAMIDVSQLPLENAIVEKRGSGIHKLYCFIDPMDRNSQEFVKHLRALEDVTIYYFMLPVLPSDGVNAKVCDAIWVSLNRVEMLHAVVDHKVSRLKATMQQTPLAEVYRLSGDLKIQGVPTFFYETGYRELGIVNLEDIRKKLDHARKLHEKAYAEE